jgi:hypothetical protein
VYIPKSSKIQNIIQYILYFYCKGKNIKFIIYEYIIYSYYTIPMYNNNLISLTVFMKSKRRRTDFLQLRQRIPNIYFKLIKSKCMTIILLLFIKLLIINYTLILVVTHGG